ncbi:MAG: 2,3-bisphosphoglycerate-independent phosphoglycerate mutase [Fastidiosipilaceae bacterium]|jgi:2,3-bisphosphoglycerate-independent phosphoglycerate mutase|nr:2,3-bisphosphoglycerate-independent phosphoglycerate mutase [Clostridiaceae bacterium]
MDAKIVFVVMDGVGIGDGGPGDAVKRAFTPTLDDLMANRPWIKLRAHGTAVGLPSDSDMGNSEVGHNALGCGQIYAQGAKRVNIAIESGEIFQSPTWRSLVEHLTKTDQTLHFIGLLSDGNVHSNIGHLKALIKQAKVEGVHNVRVHALLDGRDVPPTSGRTYIDDMEDFFATVNDESFNACFASGGGRMKITMDRYQADWKMVELGWQTHVLGRGRLFESAAEAYDILRQETEDIDQDLPPFVIGRDGEPVGKMEDGDGVVLFNFRGDRAIELSMAFDNEDFPYFDRGERPNVYYCGMLEYDGDLHIPKHFLVSPPDIQLTLSEFLVNHDVNQFAISETQKYGHVTYFWNGNRSEKFSEELETWQEIPSDRVPFEQRPWMKSAEVTDALIEAMASGQYAFLRCNYPNGDMVGHTGRLQSVVIGVESVDLALSRLIKAANQYGYTLLITADHGNSDDMLQKDKKTGEWIVKTAHSLNPVPFIIYDPQDRFDINKEYDGKAGLANMAGTVADIMGLKAPELWEPSVVVPRNE